MSFVICLCGTFSIWYFKILSVCDIVNSNNKYVPEQSSFPHIFVGSAKPSIVGVKAMRIV